MRRWIRYILPNAITCASMTAALMSIALAVSGQFETAAWFNLLCVLFDKADGTVARLLNATSRFGVEMDSLSDMLAFGVAPAVLALCLLTNNASPYYFSGAPFFQYFVYCGCFIFVIAAALRLAKFNVLADRFAKGFFFGVPTTYSGAIICTYFLTVRKYQLGASYIELMPLIMIVFAFLMVSRLPLPKVGKSKSLVGNIWTFGNLFLIYVFGLIRLFPEYLLTMGLIYLVWGIPWAQRQGVRSPKIDEAEPTSDNAVAI